MFQQEYILIQQDCTYSDCRLVVLVVLVTVVLPEVSAPSDLAVVLADAITALLLVFLLVIKKKRGNEEDYTSFEKVVSNTIKTWRCPNKLFIYHYYAFDIVIDIIGLNIIDENLLLVRFLTQITLVDYQPSLKRANWLLSANHWISFPDAGSS